jgi:hypothetical protein
MTGKQWPHAGCDREGYGPELASVENVRHPLRQFVGDYLPRFLGIAGRAHRANGIVFAARPARQFIRYIMASMMPHARNGKNYKRPSMLCRSARHASVNSCHGSEVPQSCWNS